jgi:hypothetical protein
MYTCTGHEKQIQKLNHKTLNEEITGEPRLGERITGWVLKKFKFHI